MTVRFDHAVLFVEDLDAAAKEFAAHGFDVRSGGVHAGGLTRNALIVFRDQTYLELLAFTLPSIAESARVLRASGALPWVLRGRTALDRRFLPRAARGQGLIDWAVTHHDLHGLVRAAGSWLAGPFPGERLTPDGVRLVWELAMPSDAVSPFLIRDVTDRQLRVPEGARHPNGATGIAGITIASAGLAAAGRRYATLLSTEPAATGDELVYDLQGVRVALEDADSPPGPVGVCLRGWSHDEITIRGSRFRDDRNSSG